jgi:phospholipase C
VAPARLERHGISWRVYQDTGVGLTAPGFWGWTADPYIGNYGDNSLLYFHQYQSAAPGTPLADRAKVGTEVRSRGRDPLALLADFRADVERGRLPQVSWIVAPEAYTEHPNWEPDFGAWYVSQVVEILAANPDVWSRMALFVTYDEEGGFFDHLVPPTPPQTREQGRSTVPVTNEIFPGDADHPAGPYGLGVRVPMIVVSPWTRGGWVNSQLFDHTSLIRFLEKRFGAGEPDLVERNITPWRRAVVGDLTTAFDFATPNRSRRLGLPDTDDLVPTDLVRSPDQPPVPPADQRVPRQERGVRPARALPYALHATGRADDGSLTIRFGNTGTAAAVFHVRQAGSSAPARSYTVEAGKQLSDTWSHTSTSTYDVAVHGTNGFFRRFKDASPGGATRLDVEASSDARAYEVRLALTSRGTKRQEVTVRDRYGSRATRLSLRPGQTARHAWSLHRSHGWYDLTVTTRGDDGFEQRYAGHLENGRASVTDPVMGGLV